MSVHLQNLILKGYLALLLSPTPQLNDYWDSPSLRVNAQNRGGRSGQIGNGPKLWKQHLPCLPSETRGANIMLI